MKPSISIRFWFFYILTDLICVGLGMGVPIFCILLGFPVGYLLARHLAASSSDVSVTFKRLMYYALLTAAVTMFGMVLLWGRCIALLFDPTFDLSRFGIPMILYQPRASFIGWLVLMILISPFLQFLMTLFGSHVTFISRKNV